MRLGVAGWRGSSHWSVIRVRRVCDENIVFIEGLRGDFISDDPGEASRYLKDFQLISDKSLTPADSAALLRKAAAEMG
jgi:hypothetical protein